MEAGLHGRPSSLKMISSFVKRPSGKEKGVFLALDLGGTNFRVMSVELFGDRTFKVGSTSRYTIPKDLTVGDGKELFNFIAASVDDFLTNNKLPLDKKYGLGFTFSFPVKQTAVASGELIVWTKGFAATGVEGRDVVKLLNEALSKRGISCILVSALANDTVGTLMAKSYQMPHCASGVILGTGTNACYPEEKELGGIIINTEWGNFDKFKQNRFDIELDEMSNNAGRQLFEKAVSGMYIGEIFRLVVLHEFGLILGAELQKPYSLTSADLYELETGALDLKKFGFDKLSPEKIEELKNISRLIARRSARMAVTAIVALLKKEDASISGEHVVAIDGTIYEKFPDYQKHMREFLRELLGDKAEKISFELAKDGSGVGAAIIAAVAALDR